MSAIDSLSSQNNPIKTRLERLNDNEFEELRNVYKYRVLLLRLQSTARGNILWGVLTLWLGLAWREQNVLHWFQALIGALTLIVSLWVSVRPSMQGIRAFSGLFLVAGVWNIFLAVKDNFQGLSILVALLGLVQLWWAYQYIRIYQINTASAFTEPATTAAQTYDQIWETLHQTNPQADMDFVELQLGSNRWHGWLLGDLAILGLKKGKVVYLSRENNVALKPEAAIGKKQRFNIRIKLEDISTRGKISRPSFDKYAQWKLRNNPTTSAEEMQLYGTGKPHRLPLGHLHPVLRIPLLIIGMLVLLGALCTIVLIVGVSQYH